MITSKTSRIALKNLLPGQKYAVQVRAVDTEGVASVWSRKFTFTTVTNDRKPQTPTEVTWEPSANSFTGKWKQVTKDVAGEEVDIARYEVELYSEATDRTVIVSVMDAVFPSFTLGIDRNRSLFGTAQSDLSMRVRAVSNRGLTSDWSESLRAANNPPAPVQNFTAKPIVDGIVLSWDANTEDDLAGYRIWVGPDREVELLHPNMVFEGDATTYTYFTMTYAMHSFAIVAFDVFGIESEPVWVDAEPISPFVWDDTPPEIPTGLAVTRDGRNATVTWNPPAEEDESLSGYDIMYIRSADIGKVVGQDPWLLADMRNVRAEEGTTVVLQGLDPHAAYHFKIRAYDHNINTSAWSEPVERSGTPNVPPATPTNFSLEPTGTTILARWDRNSEEDVISYVLEVDTVNTFDGAYKRTYSVAQPPETVARIQFDVPKLAEETVHYARLRAIDSAIDKPDTEPDTNKSAWTATQNATTGIDFPAESDGAAPTTAPASLTLNPGIAHFNPTWDAVANADEVQYEVHLSSGATSDFAISDSTMVLRTPSTSAFVRTLPGGGTLAYNTTYHLKVVARDKDGRGPASAAESGQVLKVTNGDAVITIVADDIQTGTLSSSIITLGSGGQIKSSDNSFSLDSNGLTINNGTVSAAVLKGGTVTSTTINIGSGGTLNVDSTAVIKSNNYVANSTGWKLDSSGLEVNNGSVSASALKGGTLSAGAIYVASGGGIYDVNGYWSITPSSINISNGSINAGAITSGTLRSDAYAVNADGSTNTAYWAWSFDKAGNAVLGNTYVRGRLLVESGVIQSSGYFQGGSTGFRIDGITNEVYFNKARINAGLFKSMGSGSRIEVGDTGINDPADEVRMFNGGTVSSIRNPSHAPGTVYMSFGGGGTMEFGRNSSDGAIYIKMGGQGVVKFTSGGQLQSRNSSDSAYSDIAGQNIKSVGTLEATGDTLLKGQVDAPNITSGGTANVNWNSSNGRFRLATSSIRFKENVKDAVIDTDKVLDLQPRTFQRNDHQDAEGNNLPVTESTPWSVGFIAEEADKLGFDPWVFRDREGKPLGFAYDQWVVAHQAVLREQRDKINELEARLSSLESS